MPWSATPLPGWKTKPGMATEFCGAVADGYVRAEQQALIIAGRASDGQVRTLTPDRDSPGARHVCGKP